MAITDDDEILNEAADMVGRIRAVLRSHSQLQDMDISLGSLTFNLSTRTIVNIHLSLTVTPKDGFHGFGS